MSEKELLGIIKAFIQGFDDMRLDLDPAIRNPPSKHQRKLKDVYDLVECLKLNVHKYEGNED